MSGVIMYKSKPWKKIHCKGSNYKGKHEKILKNYPKLWNKYQKILSSSQQATCKSA